MSGKYLIAIDVEPDPSQNPVFYCESLDELIQMMKFFFRSGYDCYVKEAEE